MDVFLCVYYILPAPYHFNAAADVSLEQAVYSVLENESYVMVCAEISNVPMEGLECDVVVTFDLSAGSGKAGKYFTCL